MNTRLPSPEKIEELVSFLPRLYEAGFTPITGWGGESEGKDGVFAMPWPEYDPVVTEFFKVASSKTWNDSEYNPVDARRMLENEEEVRGADLACIRAMLTYCVRGERFCAGHWGEMISHGYVRQLLQRLIVLSSTHD
jgi:hypothetical protein